MLCEKSCPDDAIKIDSEKREDGPGRVLTGFSIDLGRCMYCGICVEQCSTHGLRHTGDFENALHDPRRDRPRSVPRDARVDRSLATALDARAARPRRGTRER